MVVDSKRSKFSDYMSTQRLAEYVDGKETAEKIWSRTWLPSLYTDGKKRVLIIGDAVTEGMSFYYEELLGNEWSVHRQTGSIPMCDALYIERLRYALTAARKEYDVICFTPTVLGNETPTKFGETLLKVANLIGEKQKNANLVFVAHTMVDPKKFCKDMNTRIFGFNKTLEVLAADKNAKFADLGTFCEKIILDRAQNGALFTDAGYKKLTFEVVKIFK